MTAFFLSLLHSSFTIFPGTPDPTARGDGAKLPADQCSRVGADKAEWCTQTKGNVRDVPLPGSNQHAGENKLNYERSHT